MMFRGAINQPTTSTDFEFWNCSMNQVRKPSGEGVTWPFGATSGRRTGLGGESRCSCSQPPLISLFSEPVTVVEARCSSLSGTNARWEWWELGAPPRLLVLASVSKDFGLETW